MPGANWNTQVPRPWVDKLDFESGKRDRVFDSPANEPDEFVTALDDDYSAYIYTRESPTMSPGRVAARCKGGIEYCQLVARRTLRQKFPAHRARDPARRVVRRDQVLVDLTLPADWKPGTRLPGIIWFYPREYTTQAEYDHSRYTTNINKFLDTPALRPASSTKTLGDGRMRAVIEPDCPIMRRSAGKMNDIIRATLAENLEPRRECDGRSGLCRSRSRGSRPATVMERSAR